jgi:hypothetical protein
MLLAALVVRRGLSLVPRGTRLCAASLVAPLPRQWHACATTGASLPSCKASFPSLKFHVEHAPCGCPPPQDHIAHPGRPSKRVRLSRGATAAPASRRLHRRPSASERVKTGRGPPAFHVERSAARFTPWPHRHRYRNLSSTRSTGRVPRGTGRHLRHRSSGISGTGGAPAAPGTRVVFHMNTAPRASTSLQQPSRQRAHEQHERVCMMSKERAPGSTWNTAPHRHGASALAPTRTHEVGWSFPSLRGAPGSRSAPR